MTIRTALAQGSELLGREGIAEPRLTAEVLLGHAVHCDRAHFYAHPEQELREVEWLHYGRYLDERMKGKPTQYITKVQEFYGREFWVSRDVLIPRPETELLVDVVAWLVGQIGNGPAGLPTPRRMPSCPTTRTGDTIAGVTPLTLIDIGTGSGAIAVTLSLELNRRVIATDLSFEALEVARANALKLEADVDFVEADLFKCFGDGVADVVVSNPPYVPLADRDTLQREVRDWEPALALFGGAAGLCVYERLIPEAWRVLKPGGSLVLELGAGQSEAVSALASRWRNVQLFPDLAGIPRVLVCDKP